ncbi:rRNA methyltransferase 2, mitochondrial isoform X2 [Hermetia illucens]|uniref:rRNA methyltransferase 2, mitochondrial isoform X2 n=1 Tax=Hermetia illucens TaxID=343691 RepID=UPI0018CC18A2|nr:rRNA methyltransferase 2, mitochondrial isoform X2 [Hermetia illucens]XP_037922557.1 rRNA methyltransferase 2, mitochondrial isoform X2 [Hermetia illucens]
MFLRCFSTAVRLHAKVVPNNLKGKSKSSQEWLTRQLSDPYVEKAKIMNYRCRSAFKLLEIDDKYKIMKPGDVVIDCGAAPGSWTQIAATRTNASGAKSHLPKGTVVSVDVLQFHPVAGAITLGGMDFTLPTAQEKIRSILAGKQINCVLSDMAPNATGVRLLDQENITRFCYSVLKFAVSMAAANSNLVVKVWDNAEVPKLEADMLRFYDNVKRIKPRSSRSNSSEFFLLGRGFKGTEKTGN